MGHIIVVYKGSRFKNILWTYSIIIQPEAVRGSQSADPLLKYKSDEGTVIKGFQRRRDYDEDMIKIN